jgi:acetylornithine aminotransferase/acetylornithine/N-succinyldiaminopimelate aminotransferase
MNHNEIIELDNEYVMTTYGRQPVALVRGLGARVWDANGKEYLDFLAGIAVNGLGHCHPRVIEAIREQAGVLMHTSNLYYTEPQPTLAKMLVDRSAFDRVFFCNSGAEANEAAIKLARKRGKIISLDKI